jgi:Family of unknown function (DUF6339)
MTGLYVYPRLPRGPALVLLQELDGLDPATARERAGIDHSAAAPIATGPQRVPDHVIEHAAAAVRDLAESLGFPRSLSRPNVSKFDGPCGDVLLDEMQIVPADAAAEGVWSFITLVVLPDVALWRFADIAEERFIGRPRNTFRRLWWRSYTLAGVNQPANDSEPLGEDELVNIFERPSIARSARLARSMAQAVRGLPTTPGVPRSYVMRELAKRIRRLLAFTCVEILDENELDRIVLSALDDSIAAIRASG